MVDKHSRHEAIVSISSPQFAAGCLCENGKASASSCDAFRVDDLGFRHLIVLKLYYWNASMKVKSWAQKPFYSNFVNFEFP